MNEAMLSGLSSRRSVRASILPLSDTFLEKVCDVKSETANGLTYITVDLK